MWVGKQDFRNFLLFLLNTKEASLIDHDSNKPQGHTDIIRIQVYSEWRAK